MKENVLPLWGHFELRQLDGEVPEVDRVPVAQIMDGEQHVPLHHRVPAAAPPRVQGSSYWVRAPEVHARSPVAQRDATSLSQDTRAAPVALAKGLARLLARRVPALL